MKIKSIFKAVEIQPIAEKCAELKKVVPAAIAAKREAEKSVIDKIDAGFYFSVVFKTRKERDIWLESHHLELIDDDHITINQFEERK